MIMQKNKLAEIEYDLGGGGFIIRHIIFCIFLKLNLLNLKRFMKLELGLVFQHLLF